TCVQRSKSASSVRLRATQRAINYKWSPHIPFGWENLGSVAGDGAGPCPISRLRLTVRWRYAAGLRLRLFQLSPVPPARWRASRLSSTWCTIGQILSTDSMLEELQMSFSLEVDETTAAVVQRIAAEENRPASEIIRDAVQSYAN